MSTEKEYFAFISYQRKDEEWADRLRSKLEHYRLPSSVRKQDASLPKEIRPIFRDALELAGGVLAKEIQTALQQSKFLIVICSPNSAKSPWVNKEIQTFIDLDREEHIIPFIIDGIPFSGDETTECFPPALRSLKEEKELLGINIGEINRDAASIKVVARMFGLKFDILWQRYEREQRLRRWIWTGISFLLAIVGFCIGAYFIKQNRLIDSQNNQLQNFVKTLEEENNTISLLQRDQKKYSFVGELRGIESEDLSLMNFAFHPSEPLMAFSDDGGIWLHYISSNIEVEMPTKYKGAPICDICELCFSSDGTELMASGQDTEDMEYKIYVWNVENRQIVRIISADDKNYDNMFPNNKYKNAPLSEKINFGCREKKLNLYDIIEHVLVCSTDWGESDSGTNCLYNPVYDEMIFISKDRAALYDDEKRDFVLFFKGYDELDGFEYSNSGDYLRVNKNIYARTISVDTTRFLSYKTHPIKDYPVKLQEKNYSYDCLNQATVEVKDGFVVYRRGHFTKKIEVVKLYTLGNMQEMLTDAIFAGPDKIIAIVEQGRFRIYSTHSWSLLGTLTNYIWSGVESEYSVGNEGNLGHANSYIAAVKYINDNLFVLSSGGVLRIYNVNKCRLEKVIELPIENNGDDLSGRTIDNCHLTDDGSQILYSFEGQPFYYECRLP